MYSYTNNGGNNLPVLLWSSYTGCKKARAHHKARGDRTSLVILKARIWMSVLTGSVFALLRFHCIMHLPQYLSSANTSARRSGGRLRLHGAEVGPAEGLLRSESFRNLNLPGSASRWRHSCGKGRSVHFARKSPFFPSPFFSKCPCLFLE